MAKLSQAKSNSNPDIGGKAFLYREKEFRKKESSKTHLSSSTSHREFEDLPSFRDVPPIQRDHLLRQKLRQCMEIFDFSDENIDLRPKEQKRKILEEILAHVATREALKPDIYPEYLLMISKNIFRSFPFTEQKEFDPEDDEPYMDPAMKHLDIIYQLFINLLKSPDLDITIAKEYINQKFMISLLQLFDTEDGNEREYLKVILHRIYLKFISLRPFIRQQINHIFIRFVYEVERFSGIKELLDLMCGIVDGFMVPLKQEHVNFLTRVLLPLHKPKQFIQYCSELMLCVENFLAKDPTLARVVVDALQHYWPKTFSQKEVLFVIELEHILVIMDQQNIQAILKPAFTIIAKCFASYHFQVAERSLMMWSNNQIMNHIKANVNIIAPIVYPELLEVTHNHWHSAIVALASSVIQVLTELNPKLIESLVASVKLEKKRDKRRPRTVEEAWRRVEDKVKTQIPKKAHK